MDYLDVDWNQQAVFSAEAYLDFAAFSESGLIDQLEFEGFTQSRPLLVSGLSRLTGVSRRRNRPSPIWTFSAFSRSGLIDQLLFEGFTESQATYGVDKAGL